MGNVRRLALILSILTAAGLAATGLAACGSGSDTEPDAHVIDIGDAAPDDVDAPPVVAGCNPVAQTGCAPNEKCGHLIEQAEPLLARTTCVPDGAVALGEACTVGDAGPATGYDDCAKGGHCLRGFCTEVCSQAPETCAEGQNCVVFSSLFQDVDAAGLCAPACDPVVQDCPLETQACYINVALGKSSCANVPEGAIGLTQDIECYGPETGTCYLNGCDEGFGGNLNKGGPEGPGGSVCAAFCTPVVTNTMNPDNPGGDPKGITCGSQKALNHDCRFLQSFYTNTPNVPVTVGMCVPTALWGSCSLFNPEDPETMPVRGCAPLEAALLPTPEPGVPHVGPIDLPTAAELQSLAPTM